MPNRIQQGLRVANHFDGLGDGAVIQGPAIYVFSQWIEALAARVDLLGGAATPSSPDRFEVTQLWEDAIGRSYPDAQQEERHAMARQARDAERLTRQWLLAEDDHPEIQHGRFRGWRDSVLDAMRLRAWHTAEDWVSRLTAQLQDAECPSSLLPHRICLAGFLEFTRLEQALLNAFERRGVRVSIDEPPRISRPALSRRHFDSREEELSAAARWAARRVKAGRSRVAVIVNGLEGFAPMVESVFTACFHADAAMAFREDEHTGFHVSATGPLAEHPAVSDALVLLELASAGPRVPHPFPLIRRLLLSPNWSGGRTERFARASLERSLRQTGRYRWSLAGVAERAAGTARAGDLSAFIAGVNGLPAPDTDLHPAWQLLAWLEAWGWPGTPPASRRLAAVCAGLLNILETLSRQSGGSVNECLAKLKHRCAAAPLPALGGAFSPVQVLTPEQAFGNRFEAAWVANLTMQNWPCRPLGNPLLAAGSLRRIPRATEEGMLEYSRRLTAWMRTCAEEVRFSWCNRLDDQPVSASSLIRGVPVADSGTGGRSTLWGAVTPLAAQIDGYGGHPWLVSCAPERGRTLCQSGDPRLHSAVALLEMQAACPLAAYLVYRLGARAEPAPAPFSDAAFRGELVHLALARLYRPCLENGGRPSAAGIRDAVESAFAECFADLKLLPAERAALQESMLELLAEWLEFEKSWAGGHPAALEWRQRLEFEGFEFDVRVDRMNRLANGRLFLVDYKTGHLRGTRGWAEDRLGDVQLPLYAVLLEGCEGLQTAGVALAGVRMNEMKFAGLTGDPACVTRGIPIATDDCGKGPGSLQSWPSVLEHWRNSLSMLLGEYRAGDCRHWMFNERALEYSALDVLLRTAEARRWNAETGATPRV